MFGVLKNKALRLLERVITLIGRGIELIITGQCEYRLVLTPFESFDRVDNSIQAKLLLKEVRVFLESRYGLTITEPVVIELFAPTALTWEAGIYQFSGLMGRYRPCALKSQNTHLIYVLKGLTREKFQGVLVHELSHALQRENAMLQSNKVLREGMSRWLEYKILLHTGAIKEAQKLTGVKSWLYGSGIRKILQLEFQLGEQQVIPYLKSMG